MKAFYPTLVICGALVLGACSVGPDYHRPAPVALPADWRWKKAEPQDTLAKGNWWELFRDPDLNRLEARAGTQKPEPAGGRRPRR